MIATKIPQATQDKRCSMHGTGRFRHRAVMASMKSKTDCPQLGDTTSRKPFYHWPHDEGHEFQPEDRMKHSFQRVSIAGMRPLALTKKQIIALLGSVKLVDRMLWATRHAEGGWFIILREGRDLLVATESVEAAYERLVDGELPPLMPSERKESPDQKCRLEQIRLSRAGRKRKGVSPGVAIDDLPVPSAVGRSL
ncbi:MAG: hypothetical protein WC003_17390 [Terrimicrobiaceae bacterium]